MTNKSIKILVILWLSPSNTDLLMKKFDEIINGLDTHWSVFALKANLPPDFSFGSLPFYCRFQEVPVFGSRKSLISRLSYFVYCVLYGVRLVKAENIDVITQINQVKLN